MEMFISRAKIANPRKKDYLLLFTQAVILSALGLFCAGYGYSLLRGTWQADYARNWLIQCILLTGYVLYHLWTGLPHNHPKNGRQLYPTLGAGNIMTVFRGFMIAGLAGFLFSPRPPAYLAWVPGTLYILVGLADYLDGYLARKTHHETQLGENLDLSLDGIGVLVAASLVVQYGQAPAWYLCVALARYLFLGGIWLRGKLKMPVYKLPPSSRRRTLAGVQMGFIGVILLPIFIAPVARLAATFFAIPFLAGFIWDWLIVSGVAGPGRRVPNVRNIVELFPRIEMEDENSL